jgi:hypothetical protein
VSAGLVFLIGGRLILLGGRVGVAWAIALLGMGMGTILVAGSTSLLQPHLVTLAPLATNAAGGLILGLSVALRRGGNDCLRHVAMRKLLERRGLVPRDYIAFLDYAAGRVLLSRRGGGYQFFHRSLLDYFAGRSETTEA